MAAQTEPTLRENNRNGNDAYMSERLSVLKFPHKTVFSSSSQTSSPRNWLVGRDKSGVAIPLLLIELVAQKAFTNIFLKLNSIRKHFKR